MCAVLSLGLGCKKETEQTGRYQVLSAYWEDIALINGTGGPVTMRRLVKVDTVSGRTWYWEWSQIDSNKKGGWIEMTNSPDFNQLQSK